jgi:hypothetical protein
MVLCYFWFGYVGCELREPTVTMFHVNLVNPRWDSVANSPWAVGEGRSPRGGIGWVGLPSA